MKYYSNSASSLRFITPSAKYFISSAICALIAGMCGVLMVALPESGVIWWLGATIITALWALLILAVVLVFLSIMLLLAGLFKAVEMKELPYIAIEHMARKGLFCAEYGNPLGLHDGERLPNMECKSVPGGYYRLRIETMPISPEKLPDVTKSLSACLKGKYQQFGVSKVEVDIASRYVDFYIENLLVQWHINAKRVENLRGPNPSLVPIDYRTMLDLKTSGSILAAGKTRSGKTTGILALLLSVLQNGPDRFGSFVKIIDPKNAELAACSPHTIGLDDDGEAKGVISVLKECLAATIERQKHLNECSREKGDAVHWWEAGMKPSFLFVDEYVSLRSTLPKKAGKDDPDYCLATFDGLLKRLVTTGQSAGVFVIISVAEASVEEGGLPAMIRSALTTKILFRPTLDEARLMWSSEKMGALTDDRTYTAGDAWFSSTDGKHDSPSFVHFPILDFPAYGELARLLDEYNQKRL